jgi:hypothetical protein
MKNENSVMVVSEFYENTGVYYKFLENACAILIPSPTERSLGQARHPSHWFQDGSLNFENRPTILF